MRSKRSSFNKTLYAKNLTRFWPIWLIYTAILVVSIPLNFFLNYVEGLRHGTVNLDYLTRFADRYLLSHSVESVVILALLFGGMAAMAVFSYLYNARSAGLMHTLPMKRSGLFLTSYLSGLSFLFFPVLLTAVLTALAEAVAGVLNVGILARWLVMALGCNFFFFSFAVFCAMFTGHVLALPAFYGILNFLCYGMAALVDALMDLFLFGYETNYFNSLFVQWTTPVYMLCDRLRFRSVVENGVELELFTGLQYVMAYVFVGAVLTACAVVLYEVRHVETAGDVIAVPWMKPIFKFGFALCCALCGGIFLYYAFQSVVDTVLLPLAVFSVLSGAVGCFVAEMLLQKSFKVFRRGWKECGLFSLAVVALLVGMHSDPLRLETLVPDAKDVETVVFRPGHDFPPYDSGSWHSLSVSAAENPEMVEQILALHHTVVDHRDVLAGSHHSSSPNTEYFYLRLDYELKNGTSLRRNYNFYLPVGGNATELEQAQLDLVNSTDYRMSAYFPRDDRNAKAVDGWISVFNTVTKDFENVEFGQTEAMAIAAAAREDVLAGRLGIRYLSNEDEERLKNCSEGDLHLTWIYDVGPQISEYGTVITTTNTDSSTITPQFTATSLLSTLEELGILDETHVLCSLNSEGSVQHYPYVEVEKTGAVTTTVWAID